MSKRRMRNVLVVIVALTAISIVYFIGFNETKVRDNDNFQNDDEKIRSDSIFENKNASLNEFLEIEKNNSIHVFLKKSKSSVYFLDLLESNIKLKRDKDTYSYQSSIEISELDKDYVSNFIKEITPFLLSSKVDTLSFKLILPVDEGSTPKPPPPPFDFYGNTPGGKLPKLIDNPFKNKN